MEGRFTYQIRFLEYETLSELEGHLNSLGANGWSARQFSNNSKTKAENGSHGSWWILEKSLKRNGQSLNKP